MGASPRSREGYPRFLAILAMSTTVLALLGWLPARALGGDAAVVALWAACGVSFVGSVVGSLPLALGGASPAGPARLLASLGLRFGLVAGAAALIALAGWVAPRPFLIWVGVSYLVLLVVDVRYALARQIA